VHSLVIKVNYKHAVCVSVVRIKMHWQCQHKSDNVNSNTKSPTGTERKPIDTPEELHKYYVHNWSYMVPLF
jgi:hypothetical protein